MTREITLTNSKYWKGRFYPPGKQFVPDDLATYLGLPDAPSQAAIAPTNNVTDDTTNEIKAAIANLTGQVGAGKPPDNFYQVLYETLNGISENLNYVQEIQVYSGSNWETNNTPLDVTVANKTPTRYYAFPTAYTSRGFREFDLRAKEDILLRGGRTYLLEADIGIYGTTATSLVMEWETATTPAPTVIASRRFELKYADNFQTPKRGFLLVKTHPDAILTYYKLRIVTATGGNMKASGSLIVRELDNGERSDMSTMNSLFLSAISNQQSWDKKASSFLIVPRPAGVPAFQTMKIGGIYSAIAYNNVWEASESFVRCKLIVPSIIHELANQPKLSPKINNFEGYRFTIPGNRNLVISIPYKNGGKNYRLDFGTYGSDNPDAFVAMADISANISHMLNSPGMPSTFNNSGEHVIEIGVYQSKWLILADGVKFISTKLVNPDTFPLEYAVAPKSIGAEIAFERIIYS